MQCPFVAITPRSTQTWNGLHVRVPVERFNLLTVFKQITDVKSKCYRYIAFVSIRFNGFKYCYIYIFFTQLNHFVAYWPRLSSQKKNCTSVNNRCIRSKISGDQGWPWLSRGWIECEIVTLAWRRVEVKLLYNHGDRKFRLVGEKMLEWEPCPREAGPTGPRLSSPWERERNAVLAIRVGVNMLQFCSVSNSPLTQ